MEIITFNRDESESKIVRLNVGGHHFETTRSTINIYPNSILAKMVGQLGKPNDKEIYFIDRDPDCFSAVLNYYRTNILVRPLNINPILFKEEIKFWGLASNEDINQIRTEEAIKFINIPAFYIYPLSNHVRIQYIY